MSLVERPHIEEDFPVIGDTENPVECYYSPFLAQIINHNFPRGQIFCTAYGYIAGSARAVNLISHEVTEIAWVYYILGNNQ
jgi:hypothetical protein